MASILVIEDDLDIRRLVADSLAAEGHNVESAAVAMDGLREALSSQPDVVVLDLGLPDLDGAELLRMLRAVSAVPVVVATARASEEEIVRLLDAGADDYVVKPFSAAQLAARVRAVLRRVQPADGKRQIDVGGLHIDAAGRIATLDGVLLDLSPKEFDLLKALAERAGEVVERRELMGEVWRQPYGGADRTLDVHLSWLRKKLGESAQAPRYLHTVHGVGVKLRAPED